MAGVSRFDCFPSDFLNGVIGLTADQIAAYTVVMMLQYDRGEPVLFVGREKEIAVRSGMSVGRIKSAIARLCEVGKLEFVDGERVSNDRTVKELRKIERRISENRENSAKGGIANKEKWEGKRNNNSENESRPASQSDSPNIALFPPSPVLQPKEEDPSDLCPKPVRTKGQYSEDFQDWWSAYPTDSNMSKAEAFKVWKRLPEADKKDARASLSAFNRYCTSHSDYRPVHANRYLSQRRWEGHLKLDKTVSKKEFVHRDSPQWSAWVDYLRSRGKGAPPTNERGGWFFDSEWPPSANDAAHRRASA